MLECCFSVGHFRHVPRKVFVLMVLGLIKEGEDPYGGYSTGYQVMGWVTVATPLVLILVLAMFPLQNPPTLDGDKQKAVVVSV